MTDIRKNALTEFLNDYPDTLQMGLYQWRGKHYEVLPYKTLAKTGTKHDQFMKYTYKKMTYGIREISKALILKRYNLTID